MNEAIIKQRRDLERKNEEIRREICGCRTAIGHHKNSIRKNEKKIREMTDVLNKNQQAYEKIGKVLFTINQS